MLSPFGPTLKIKRANEHIEEIQDIIKRVFSGDVYSIVEAVEPESGDRWLKLKFTGYIPETLYTRIPETAYHLRSALDQLAVALAKANGLVNTKGIYFPFAGSANSFNSVETQKKIEGINPSATAIIHEFKPYKGGNDSLWALSRLCNVDKHSDLIPIGAIGNINAIQSLRIKNAKIGIIIGGSNRLDEGIAISNLGTVGTIESIDKSKPNFEVSGDVAFGDIDIFHHKSVVTTLKQLSFLVDEIVTKLRPFC